MKMSGKKEAMTSRERVLAAAKGQPVDRVPVMYWINPHAAARLIAEFYPAKSRFWNLFGRRSWKRFNRVRGRLPEDIRVGLPLLLQVYANADYPVELGADIMDVPYGSAGYWGRIGWRNGRFWAKDGFGSERGICGIYLEVRKPGIASAEDLKDHRFPDATHDRNYALIRRYRKRFPDACIITDNFGVQDFLSTNIWEMSRFMMALYDHPDEIKAWQARWADYMIEIARRSIDAGADIIYMYDDYGYTGRPLISMDMWREFTLPHLKRQVEAIHDAGGLVMLHSCGYQMSFLPHYVEAELDILQSLQPKAGNSFEEAVENYGDRLAFCTGIDIQRGDFMSVEELRSEIISNYRIGKKHGRHILGMTHMLQHTMPAENIRAIFDTVRQIQAGEHDTTVAAG